MIFLLRFISYKMYQRSDQKDLKYWYRVFFIGVLGTSLTWSSATILLFVPDNPILQIFLVYILSSMVAGAISSLTHIFHLYAMFNILILLPLCVQYFLSGSSYGHFIASLTFTLGLFTLFNGLKNNKIIVEVLELQENNKKLINNLSVEKEQAIKLKELANEANKRITESIEYASLIQDALIPDDETFGKYFQGFFTLWSPKDVVGGDIYFFDELRNKDECLLMIIDCTGHGVPGAFVTMLVKAFERQTVAEIRNSDKTVNTANLLGVFNRDMKRLLKQESIDSISNAGFDGAIIYYNKKDRIIKFAGAETPLFYIEDEELKMIKGNRYSVGYKKCSMDHEYEEHTIEVKEGMQFYLTTDGYIDQNGGDKAFPMGNKSFKNIINKYHGETMADQRKFFLDELQEYQRKEERNDDVTLIGFKI
jgi:serine phosphatase RsbU (regulator of sigma subunit)